MLKYYIIADSGEKGFVTHEDNAIAYVENFPANIWVTENTEWAQRVGATETTKESAQTLLNDYINYLRSVYVESTPEDIYPKYIELP
jgi:hypothetical protein